MASKGTPQIIRRPFLGFPVLGQTHLVVFIETARTKGTSLSSSASNMFEQQATPRGADIGLMAHAVGIFNPRISRHVDRGLVPVDQEASPFQKEKTHHRPNSREKKQTNTWELARKMASSQI